MGAVGGLAVLALVRQPGGGHAGTPNGGQAEWSGAGSAGAENLGAGNTGAAVSAEA